MDSTSPGVVQPTPVQESTTGQGSIPIITTTNQNSANGQIVSTISDLNMIVENSEDSHRMNKAKDWKVESNRYLESSRGPFTVFVQSINDKVGLWHPTKLGKLFLMEKIQGIIHLKRVSRNKIQVDFMTYLAANNFVSAPFLERYQFKAFIPSSKIQRVGIIRNIDDSITEEDLRVYLKAEIPILRIQRIMKKIVNENRESVLTPTRAVKIWFLGQTLPARAFLFYNAIPVEPFVFSVLQCRKCLRFGHIEDQCKGKTTCAKCAQDHLTGTCSQSNRRCANCMSPDHLGTDRKCPKYLRQRRIKEIMASHNCAFHDVFTICPELHEDKRIRRGQVPQSQDFPPLTTNDGYHDTYARHVNGPSPARYNSDHMDVYSTAQKRPKTMEASYPATTNKLPRSHQQGFDRVAYSEALLYPHGRQPTPLEGSNNTNINCAVGTGGERSPIAAVQSGIPQLQDQDPELIVAVNTLEQILMASANPIFKSLAKMIRATLNAPYRPILITHSMGKHNG